MTALVQLSVTALDLDAIAARSGRVVVLVSPDGKLGQAARRINRLTKGALARFLESAAFETPVCLAISARATDSKRSRWNAAAAA